MSRKIMIEPVTRIEGHAKVGVYIGDNGKVERAVFHVNEFRGFEKFCEGRLFFEMPLITERICGICPVSHHLASAKACDMIIGVDPPRPARLLRELMHMGQTIQSHSMHFFHLAAPDLLLGFDADPAVRNVVGVAGLDRELAGKAIALRKYGQEMIAALGGRRVHPNFAVPGGVNAQLHVKERDALLAAIPTMRGYVVEAIALIKAWMQQHQDLLDRFAVFSSSYLGLVDEQGQLQLYDGDVRLVNKAREHLITFDPSDYLLHIAEHVESTSYLKSPYYKAHGWPAGIYRVGPLGRLNASTGISTPLAQKEYELFHQLRGGKVIEGSLYYHYARLIEDLHAIELAERLLLDPEILSDETQISGNVVNDTGVGCIEAPRGTLWHHYQVDENGRLLKVNLIVATGNNNAAMSLAVDSVAKTFVDPQNVTEGALNRIEAAIRAYDPCLSCSTHAWGSMPLQITVFDSHGREVNRVARNIVD